VGPRGWLIILVMGVGGLFSFGLLTKLVIDQSPDLKNIIRFKAALLRDFSEKGIQEVQLRREQRQAYCLSLTPDRSLSEKELVRLDGEVAEYFLKEFGGKSVQMLRISYLSEGSGCQGGTEYRTKEMALNAFRRGLLSPGQRDRLEKRLKADLSCRLVSLERRGPTVEVAVESPPGFAGDARQLALRLESLVREEFRQAPYGDLSLRIAAGPGGEPGRVEPGATSPAPEKDPSKAPSPLPSRERRLPLEVRFDFQGKELRG